MIRYATKQELPEVNEIRRQVNDVHIKGRPDIFRDGFCKELEDSIYKAWEDEHSDVIVAIREENICGYAMVEYIEKPLSSYSQARKYFHVAEFCVDENYRRQGIATELIEFIKEQAKQKGFNILELDVWEFNESALKLYESTGFRTYRRHMECNL